MLPLKKPKKTFLIIFAAVLVFSIVLVTLVYWVASSQKPATLTANQATRTTVSPSPTIMGPTKTPVVPTPTLTPSPLLNPATILGIDSDPQTSNPGISWVRLNYPTCGWGNLTGNTLKNTIQSYHQAGIYVLLITCQTASSGPRLFNTQQLADIAQGGADAVQCGNEEMKIDPFTIYVAPADFARYYDLCARAVHAVQPNTPVLLGALDPHVGGVDYQPLLDQVSYLNQVQAAMNTVVHPGGNWSWRSQIVGLIDSWHNGYPNQYTNSLYSLFVFWAQQFHVDLNSGGLGKHLWVVEGTGCFKGCGINQYSPYEVAVSHILTLITDVQTTMRYHIPFFYFSDKDFVLNGLLWPMGVLDLHGHSKPIRQDLPMGAHVLTLSCASGQLRVADQELLLAKLYQGCTLPANYFAILTS